MTGPFLRLALLPDSARLVRFATETYETDDRRSRRVKRTGLEVGGQGGGGGGRADMFVVCLLVTDMCTIRGKGCIGKRAEILSAWDPYGCFHTILVRREI